MIERDRSVLAVVNVSLMLDVTTVVTIANPEPEAVLG